jgi:hypothetical protein
LFSQTKQKRIISVLLNHGTNIHYLQFTKPLKTESTNIRAAVPIAIPKRESQEIMCTKLLLFWVEK